MCTQHKNSNKINAKQTELHIYSRFKNRRIKKPERIKREQKNVGIEQKEKYQQHRPRQRRRRQR